MMLTASLTLCLVFLLSLHYSSAKVEFLAYLTSTTSCPPDFYFNSLNFTCTICPQNSTTSSSFVDGDSRYSRCFCDTTSYSATGMTPCTRCPLYHFSTRDGKSCLPCATSYQTNITKCGCGVDEKIVDTDLIGNYLPSINCTKCPANTAVITADVRVVGYDYKANLYTCQSCPDPMMILTRVTKKLFSCKCPTGYVTVGVPIMGASRCLLQSTTTAYASQQSAVSLVTYKSGLTITSATFQHYFLYAASTCASLTDTSSAMEACQTLANLCVLSMYDDSTGSICNTFQTIAKSRVDYNEYQVTDWYDNMPMLRYSNPGSVVCYDTSFKRRLLYLGRQLKFWLVKYSLNGTFLGYNELGPSLAYCKLAIPRTSEGGGESTTTDFLIFAHTTKSTYTCGIATFMLATAPEQVFYELLLQDVSAKLYPVPIRIVNLQQSTGVYNDARPANKLCDADDILVRRFFLYDIVSGIQTGSGNYRGTGKIAPAVLRYAKTISLDISLVEEKQPLIYAPVLTIEYGEFVNPATIGTSTTMPYTVEVRYTKSSKALLDSIRQGFIAGMVITGLLFFLRYTNWSKRNTRTTQQVTTTTSLGGLNITVLANICILAMHSWVLIFFPFVVMTCWYIFVYFKIQKFPSLMLPPVDDIYVTTSPYFWFVCAVIILGAFQLAYVLVLIVRQSYADIFFIDWEPSQAKADGATGRVSVWRSILIGNEWSELQVMRKTDIRLTLFFIIFLYFPLQYQYDATQQPTVTDHNPGDPNPVLRFATNTWWWLLFTTMQYYWSFLIYQRCFSEPPEQVFIDLCTLAKVSVIVLDEEYHGYYLHCRSPHQFADGTMVELLDMLSKEEAGLTVDRSLEGAPADVQAFEIFLSGEWRQAFDKLFMPLKSPASISDILHSGKRNARQGGMARYHTLLLMNFINKAILTHFLLYCFFIVLQSIRCRFRRCANAPWPFIGHSRPTSTCMERSEYILATVCGQQFWTCWIASCCQRTNIHGYHV